MKKVLKLMLILLFTANLATAASIDKAISDSGINKSAVSISVKDVQSGKTLYELNSKKPVPPASTLKILTLAAVLNELGYDYEFTTTLYKNTNNDLILKLGADPFLTSKDLRTLLKKAKEKNITPKNFYIDDTIVDKTDWGEGWQWDDDLNPLMPKFSAYNIDKNLLKITVEPTVKDAPAQIKLDVFYPVTFVNLVTTSDTNSVEITRNNSIAPDVLNVEGTVLNRIQREIPINHLKRYFILRLEDAIRSEKIEYYGNFGNTKLSGNNIYEISKITHPMQYAIDEIMKNSNNMVAETLFKLAGGHYAKTTGSAQNAVEMLLTYCKNLNVNTDDIKIVDGSGVSKNNLVTSDFMTAFLISQYKADERFKDIFAAAGEGTLANRMLYFGKNLKAKTGTLSDISAITGYLRTSGGKVAAFNITINDPKSKNSDKKMLEEYILRAIHTSY